MSFLRRLRRGREPSPSADAHGSGSHPIAAEAGWTNDPAATAGRRAALEAYFARQVLSGEEFVCQHRAACRAAAVARGAGAYHEAQLSFLGPHYDLRHDGVPLRILIAPMEVGQPPDHVSMTMRSTQIDDSQAAGYGGRNQHMKGTTIALRLAFGRAPDDPREHLEISGQQVALFDAFAMANLLLCSAVDPQGGKKSLGTKIATMRDNCLPHLLETIRILEPTLVVNQGVDVGRALGRVLAVRRRLSDRVAEAELDGLRFAWVDLRHPSRNWFSPTHAYGVEVAQPALVLGRELALSIAAA